MTMKYKRSYSIIALPEEVTNVVCRVANALNASVLAYVQGPPTLLRPVSPSECEEYLNFFDILLSEPDWGKAHLYVRSQAFSPFEVEQFALKQPTLPQTVSLQVPKPFPDKLSPTWLGVVVDEDHYGALDGENPMATFQSIRRAFNKLEVPGKFVWEVSGKVSEHVPTHYHWTSGVRDRYRLGLQLYEDKVRILAE